MEIKITKKDILWSYIAQLFMMGTGLITLPLILKMLNSDEVGLNYIFISLNSVIALFDMGFSSQFGRNITYVLSGAQKLQKDGISMDYKEEINERLLAATLTTARYLYNRIAWVALFVLMSLGTYYIYCVTEGFSSISNLPLIWSIFCASCFFNLYYLYLNSFLQGRGMIKETKKGQVYSKLIQIIITYGMLLCDYGLISVVLANLISPFVFRFYTYNKFFDNYIKVIYNKYQIEKSEILEIFKILLHNAKKMGVISLLAAAIGYSSTLIIGGFLPLSEVASYGLMVQLVGIIASVSYIHFGSLIPQLGNLMVQTKMDEIAMRFGLSVGVCSIVQIAGILVLLNCPFIFDSLGFKTQLPSHWLLFAFAIYKFVEQIQSLYCQLLLVHNNTCFFPAAVSTGVITIFLMVLLLCLNLGLTGVVLAQCLPLYAYSGWKWPVYVSNKYNIKFKQHIVVNTFIIICQTVRKCKN